MLCQHSTRSGPERVPDSPLAAWPPKPKVGLSGMTSAGQKLGAPMRGSHMFWTWIPISRAGFVLVALCTLAVVGCSSEPRFPFDAAKGATAIRISHANVGVQPGVREINDSAVLKKVLRIIDRFDSWEPMPECRTGECSDITIEWVAGDRSLVRMSLCSQGHRARVGEPGPASPCGRHVPASAAAALLNELGES
jgi:hypothetical protein